MKGGEGNPRYIPNPNANCPASLLTFKFIGKFIGLSIRHDIKLDIDLVPFIF
jgi:hypothetical protein